MARFLPSFRPRSHKSVVSSEVKAVLQDYYSSLWQYQSSRRAKYWPVERAVTEGYERVIWVFKAVNTIGADQARLPFRLKQKGEILDDHPLYRVLNKKANEMETGQVFRKRLSAQILLSKQGAFVEKTYSNGGSIIRVDLLPPDRVQPMPSEDGKVLVEHFLLTRMDGTTRKIDPKKVLWFRDPHPLDPYSGVTPLESAGLSVELDYFARLYNVNFMQNDGRPGGVLAVRGANPNADVPQAQMDRIESKFGRGPIEAGKLSVVAGELDYVDLAARPRDMQYGQTSRNSKIELLSAFGVAESVLGYAADRTFDNAEQELYNYWTRTMLAHNEIIVSGFDEDSDDDLEGYLDTSGVEVLERAEAAKRSEAREEFTAGLRSIISYAQVANIDGIDDTAYTRALYLPTGKTPLPANEADAITLGLASSPKQNAPTGDLAVQGAPAALPPGAPGAPELTAAPHTDPAAAPAAPAAAAPAAAAPVAGAAAAALAAATGSGGAQLSVVPSGKRARVVLEIKRALPPLDEVRESDLDQRSRDRLEDTITAALTMLSDRWIKRTVERVKSPRSRKGTRHWQADSPTDIRGGTKALDSAKAVDEDRWADEAETGTEPIIKAFAVAAAAGLFADLVDDDVDEATKAAVVAGTVAAIILLIRQSAARQAMKLIRIINDADQNDESLDDIILHVRGFQDHLDHWSAGLAVQVATGTAAGARDAAATEIAATSGDVITRTWLSRRDERVRHSHFKADGQQQPIGQPFVVGRSLLRFPCDPLAPVEETANCRCRLLHRSKRSGQFVAAPMAIAVSA